MTQSGQGEEPQLPAARPAHEGVVLPADGGEPLVPGTYGADGTVPAGGTPWGGAWGPDSAQAAAPHEQPGTGYAHGEAWGQGVPQGAPQEQQQPLPRQDHSMGGAALPPQQQGQQGYSMGAGALPPQQQGYVQDQSQGYAQDQSQGGYAQDHSQGYSTGGAALPPQQGQVQPLSGQYGAGPGGAALPPQQQPAQQQPQPAQPQQPPPAQQQHQHQHQHQHQQQQQQQQQQPYAAPLPPQSGPGAPLPPAAAAGGAPLPPEGADAEATQYIPPVPPGQGQAGPPGALPPENPAESTQFLGRAVRSAAPGSPDSEATQYIPPVPAQPTNAPYGIRPGAPGDRRPPAEFDSLFRSEPAADGAGATQQMPRIQEPPQQQYAPPAAAHHDPGYDDGPRRSKRVPILAAVGVGIVAIGVGVGALLGLGGGEEKGDKPKNVAESAPASEKPSPTADPAKQQAIALDKLLADSNNSRQAVIDAVNNIESCKSLPQAATDLRDAAKQRNNLVDRLSRLPVGELENNDRLTASLTKAWKSSAAADDHFAAWAGQVKGKKGCHKGKARRTSHHAAAVAASGEATTAKKEAARLWNVIADKYGLAKHTPIEL